MTTAGIKRDIKRLRGKLARARKKYWNRKGTNYRSKRVLRTINASKQKIKRRKNQLDDLRRSASDRRWGGSRAITNEVIRIVGNRASVSSRKRWELFGNPSSDHYRGNLTADAVDFRIAEAHWLKNTISRELGGPRSLADYGSFIVTRNGHRYRVQIIAGTHGTGPHLHVGVRRI